ncbi:MAG TPA: hypothetical protein VN950_00910 [Terriglobales bacterium]|nr:hypothetical protein [Terriglobales bacterium]
MGNRLKRFELLGYAAGLGLVVALVTITSSLLLGSTQSFSVPDDVALRIRLDDTLTSTDSEVGDPFSATVLTKATIRTPECTDTLRKLTYPAKSRAVLA